MACQFDTYDSLEDVESNAEVVISWTKAIQNVVLFDTALEIPVDDAIETQLLAGNLSNEHSLLVEHSNSI